MKKTVYLIIIAAITLVAVVSCKREIDFDYNNVDAQLVVEAELNETGIKVLVTTTQDMDMLDTVLAVTDAGVELTDSDGKTVSFKHYKDGYYVPVEEINAEADKTYTITVNYKGNIYTSRSTMQRSVRIKSTDFKWENGVFSDGLVMHLKFDDIKDQTNYYVYHMYRNKKIYKWGVIKDLGYENAEIDKIVVCTTRDKIEKNDPDDHKKILYEGDSIYVTLKGIDKGVYDYLFSLHSGMVNRANPITNFEGGCLGYFSANSFCDTTFLFHLPE